MNRRSFRRWAAWLLPLLALRAFLPGGFMLSAQADGLALVFCTGEGPALVQPFGAGAGADHALHHAQHTSHHASHLGHGHAQLDPPCPYAVAAIGLDAGIPHCGVAALPLSRELVPPPSIFLPGAGPLRADRIRGPPSLS